MKQSRWIYNIHTLEVKLWPKNTDLPIDWKYGKKPKLDTRNHNASAFGHVWINNGISNLFIKQNELDFYMKNGWTKGRLIKKCC